MGENTYGTAFPAERWKRFVIKTISFIWSKSCRIKKESGEDVFIIKRPTFFSHNYSLCDITGNELVSIQPRFRMFVATYDIFLQGQLYASVEYNILKQKRKFGISKPFSQLTVKVPSSDNLNIEGTSMRSKWSITRNGVEVARFSFRWATFTIDIADDENNILILSVILAVYCAMCDDGGGGS